MEDRQPGEGRLLGRAQPLIRGLEDGAHAAVARGHIAQLGGQQVEAALDRRRDVGGREGTGPACRKLDRQRHAIDQPARCRATASS